MNVVELNLEEVSVVSGGWFGSVLGLALGTGVAYMGVSYAVGYGAQGQALPLPADALQPGFDSKRRGVQTVLMVSAFLLSVAAQVAGRWLFAAIEGGAEGAKEGWNEDIESDDS